MAEPPVARFNCLNCNAQLFGSKLIPSQPIAKLPTGNVALRRHRPPRDQQAARAIILLGWYSWYLLLLLPLFRSRRVIGA
jgi:hypothetical protein